MARPPLPIGTAGKIMFVPLAHGQTQARAKFRNYDGTIRLVSGNGRTKAAAERELKIAIAYRQPPPTQGAITPTTRVSDLAAAWLESAHNWSTGTERTYRSVVKNQIVPTLGALRVREVTTGGVSRALRGITDRHGAGAAKSAKACLSGMFVLAVDDAAVSSNPVHGASARLATGTSRKAPRALTAAETDKLTGLLRADERACALDLPDLVDWMLATGCRIGKALALRHGVNGEGKQLLDLDANTWEVNATVVRVPGPGLIVQPRPKTAAGWRVVAVPSFAAELVRARRANADGIVFSSPATQTLRDTSNASGDLRQVLDGFDCNTCRGSGYQLQSDGSLVLGAKGQRVRCDVGPWSWVTSHVFRKTVATRLDEAGLTARQVADQLGHANPSMTLDVYFGRNVVSSTAAEVLDREMTK